MWVKSGNGAYVSGDIVCVLELGIFFMTAVAVDKMGYKKNQ